MARAGGGERSKRLVLPRSSPPPEENWTVSLRASRSSSFLSSAPVLRIVGMEVWVGVR